MICTENMWRLPKYKFDVADIARKLFASYKRLFLLLLGICTFFYILPPVFRYLFWSTAVRKDPLRQCIDDRLAPFIRPYLDYNVNIQHVPPLLKDHKNIPYVGNGYFGLEISADALLYIKYGRVIQLVTQIQPLISIMRQRFLDSAASAASSADNNGNDNIGLEATVTEYLTGMVWRFQCFPGYFISHTYYAHRTNPHILMQELKFTNMLNFIQDLNLLIPRLNHDIMIRKRTITLPLVNNPIDDNLGNFKEFYVTTGLIKVPPNEEAPTKILLTVVIPLIPKMIKLNKRSSFRLEIPMVIYYSKPSKIDYTNDYNNNMLKNSKIQQEVEKLNILVDENELKAITIMTNFLQNKDTSWPSTLQKYRHTHIMVWNNLWSSGLTISTSKAEKALNGDRINATMYAVLSQARSYEYEDFTGGMQDIPSKQEIAKALTYAEGCYDSYHTLQAENLWLPMTTLQELINLVSTWMLTLEKQGCHNLLRAGASGVMQGMVLSFGSFRFSNQHLECNIAPQYLHRDFHFRRLNYGNHTHVNVTITVRNDNKAVINVALDRSDGSYYACDGGCMDEPVLLTQNRHQFPVKVTEPLTAILYITEDKQHIMELHKALHVKEVAEAPAYEHHVIALHKHGHHLGGLPTLFWVSICAIIIVFHIFLCKLIVKEYCESSDKLRYRYNKP